MLRHKKTTGGKPSDTTPFPLRPLAYVVAGVGLDAESEERLYGIRQHRVLHDIVADPFTETIGEVGVTLRGIVPRQQERDDVMDRFVVARGRYGTGPTRIG